MSAREVAMTDWSPRANDIFLRALEVVPAPARRHFLDQECHGNPQLRAQVEHLLTASDSAADFLETPLSELAAVIETAQAEPSSGQELTGKALGHYKLQERIGEGGFGTVYMAEQQEPVRRRVAVKIIKPGMDSQQVIARFEAERQALALMDHPSIARVLDGGTTESGRPYFVMEFVKGMPITQYSDENQLAIRDRLALFTDVCH